MSSKTPLVPPSTIPSSLIHTKTNPDSGGGQQASDKFKKQQQQKDGTGADNAPGKTAGDTVDKFPGKAAVASDSGSTAVGVEAGQNNPGEKGISGVPVDSAPQTGNAKMGGT